MTSTLLLSACDIPAASIYISPLAPADEDLTEYNLISPNRASLFKFQTGDYTNSIRFDLGTLATKAADHVIISRADIMRNATANGIELTAGSDGSTFGTVAYNDFLFDTATLYGPRSNDYVAEFTTTSAFRWWKMEYQSGDLNKFCHSTLSFGSFFDFGCDVSSYIIDRVPAKESKFYADSGATFHARVSEEIYKFTMTWRNVTIAKATTFMSTIGRYAGRLPIFLYTTTAGGRHEILDSKRLIQTIIVPGSIKRRDAKYNRQEISIDFEEVLG